MDVLTVYMEITKDKYELPIAVADTAGELAKICGTTKNAILSSISKSNIGFIKPRYIRVKIED